MSPVLRDEVAMMKANSPHAAIAKPTVAAFARVRGVAHTPVAILPNAAREKSDACAQTVGELKERMGTANLGGRGGELRRVRLTGRAAVCTGRGGALYRNERG
jgi:hypothetical protein